jgi:hypothetical protein
VDFRVRSRMKPSARMEPSSATRSVADIVLGLVPLDIAQLSLENGSTMNLGWRKQQQKQSLVALERRRKHLGAFR